MSCHVIQTKVDWFESEIGLGLANPSYSFQSHPLLFCRISDGKLLVTIAPPGLKFDTQQIRVLC